MKPLDTTVLPAGTRSRFVDDIDGLRVHILESGFDPPGRPIGVNAARLSGNRLFLAQTHAVPGRRRLFMLSPQTCVATAARRDGALIMMRTSDPFVS